MLSTNTAAALLSSVAKDGMNSREVTSYDIKSLLQARLCFEIEAVDDDGPAPPNYGNRLFDWARKHGATYDVSDVQYELHDSANEGDVKMRSEVRLVYKSRSKFDDMVDEFVKNELQGSLTYDTSSFSSYVRYYYSELEQGHESFKSDKHNVLVVLFAPPPFDDALKTSKVIKGECREHKFLCCHVASIPNAVLHNPSLAAKKGSLGSYDDMFTTPPQVARGGYSGFPPNIKKVHKCGKDWNSSLSSSSDDESIDSLCTEALMKEVFGSPTKRQKKL